MKQLEIEQCAKLKYDKVLQEFPKAKAFQINGERVIISKSEIRKETESYIVVPIWVADKEAVTSRWRK